MIKELIGDCVLYLGNCLEIMPTLNAVDCIITDPIWPDNKLEEFKDIDPYELFKNAYSVFPPHKRASYILNCDSNPLLLSPVKEKFFRAIYLRYHFPGYKGRILNSGLFAYCFGEPPPVRPGRALIAGECNAGICQSQKKKYHPCPRRQEHMNFVVENFSAPKEVILDPFMGSGTTGVACAQLGRKFIGIEINPEYFDIARRRIEAEVKQGKLF